MFRGAENIFLNDMCYVYLVATPGLWYKGQVNGLGVMGPFSPPCQLRWLSLTYESRSCPGYGGID